MMSSWLNDYVRGTYCFPTTFGRTALYAALRAANVEGKEVLCPALTCKHTVVDAIVQAGAHPVFVDIDLPSLAINVRDLEAKCSAHSASLVSHHYYGAVAPNIEELTEFCRKRSLTHIEDCSHSFGASLNGRNVGTFGDMAVFSFSKMIATSAGGCVTTDQPRFAEQLKPMFVGQSMLLEVLKNYYTNRFKRELIRDYSDIQRKNLVDVAGNGLALLLRVATGTKRETVLGRFYRLSSDERSVGIVEMSVGMSERQGKNIPGALSAFRKQLPTRKALFERVAESLDVLLPHNSVSPAYTMAVIRPKDVEKLKARARKFAVRLREPWPAFQPYWRAQRTPNVEEWGRSTLLLNLYQYLESPRRERLEDFLSGD